MSAIITVILVLILPIISLKAIKSNTKYNRADVCKVLLCTTLYCKILINTTTKFVQWYKYHNKSGSSVVIKKIGWRSKIPQKVAV